MKSYNDSGKHYIINCLVDDSSVSKLEDLKEGKAFILSVINNIGMTLIGDLSSHKFTNGNLSLHGYSINGMLKESHINIHTWPECNSFSFDVYSCKDFKESVIKDIICSFFKIKSIEGITIKRSSNEKFVSGSFSIQGESVA